MTITHGNPFQETHGFGLDSKFSSPPTLFFVFFGRIPITHDSLGWGHGTLRSIALGVLILCLEFHLDPLP